MALRDLIQKVKPKLAAALNKATEEQPPPIAMKYDGEDVDDLVRHLVNLRTELRDEREALYVEGYRQHQVNAWKWYIGRHWEVMDGPVQDTLGTNKGTLVVQSDLVVENRIAEKIDGAGVPIMIQQQPDAVVKPRTDADKIKAELLNTHLHKRLQDINADILWIEQAQNEMQQGRAFWYQRHDHSRDEDKGGRCTAGTVDPIGLAWTPADKPLSEARCIVHTYTMDVKDAQTHFSMMLQKHPKDFAKLQGKDKNDIEELAYWNLQRFINGGGSAADKSHFKEVLISEFWLMDSERTVEPVMEMVQEVLPPEAVPAEDEEWQERAIGEPQMIGYDDFGQEQYATPTEKYRMIERQQEDEQGNKFWRSYPVYPNGRLTFLIGDQHVVDVGNNPHMHGEFPFGESRWRPDCEPFVTSIINDQAEINRTRTQMSNHGSVFGIPIMLFKNAILPAEIQKAAVSRGLTREDVSEVYGVEDDVDMNNAARVLESPELNRSVTENYQAAGISIDRSSAISEESTGRSPRGAPASRAVVLDSKTVRRFEVPSSYRDRSIERFNRLFLWDIFQYDPKDEIVRTLIDQPVERIDPATGAVIPDMIQQEAIMALYEIFDNPETLNYDIVLVAGRREGMTPREARMRGAAEDMQLAQGNPAIAQLSDESQVQKAAAMTPGQA